MIDMFHKDYEMSGNFDHGWLKVWNEEQGLVGYATETAMGEMTKEDMETFWRARLTPGDVKGFRQEMEWWGC
jgi:hypothetical protein